MDYTTLDSTEKLTQARDRLHGLEIDHYRVSLLGDSMSTSEQAEQSRRELQIEALRAEVAKLETPTEGAQNAPA